MDKILESIFGIKSLIWRQFIIYGFVALIPTMVDFGLVYILTEHFSFYYLDSVMIGFILALGVSYLAQKNITFKNKSEEYVPQFSIFSVISLGGLFLSIIFISIFVEFFGLWYILAKAIAQILIYIWSFLANRFITFNKS